MALNLLGVGMIMPILPKFAQSFGISITLVGLVVAARGLGRLVTDLPAGHLADRLGRRGLLLGGPALIILGALGSGLATSFQQLFVFRIVQGAGSAIMHTAAVIVLADITSPSHRGRIMSIYQGTMLTASALGPYLGGVISQHFGLRAPFFVRAALTFLALLWTYLRMPETRAVAKVPADPPTADPASHQKAGNTSWEETKGLLLNRNFLLISLLALGLFFTQAGGRQAIVPLLGYSTLSLNEVQVGLALSLAQVLNITLVFGGGRVADRFGRKAAILPGSLLMVLALVLFTRSTAYLPFLLSAMILGAGRGIIGAVPQTYAADIAPAGRYGSTLGLYRTLSAAGILAGPLVLGWLADTRGLAFPLEFNAALVLTVAVLFALLARETVRRPKKEVIPDIVE
jgi:MFS family permease